MNSARPVPEDLRHRGVVAYRVGEKIRLRPARLVTPALLDRVRRHREELLVLLTDCTPATVVHYQGIYRELARDVGDSLDAAAFRRHAERNGFWVVDEINELERRCTQLARDRASEVEYRAAVITLVTRVRQLRAWHGEAREGAARETAELGPWRFVVEENHPVRGPVQLADGCTTIADPCRAIALDLAALACVLVRMEADAMNAEGSLIEDDTMRLAACGCRVRVEVMS